MKNITIIGGGNLGSSIAQGLAKSKKGYKITLTKRHLHTLQKASLSKSITLTSDNVSAVKDANIILLCVKPYNISEVIQQIKPSLHKDQIIVSTVSGVDLNTLAKELGTEINIFRAMPNTAISTQESMTCLSNKNSNPKSLNEVKTMFSHLGEVIEINDDLMNAATVLGACGIAYVMRFLRAMVQGGIEIGFDSKTAEKIANQTVKGAVELLNKNHTHPEQEIDKVTTPKGCTIAGLNEMEHQGFSSALIKGIKTSFENLN